MICKVIFSGDQNCLVSTDHLSEADAEQFCHGLMRDEHWRKGIWYITDQSDGTVRQRIVGELVARLS